MKNRGGQWHFPAILMSFQKLNIKAGTTCIPKMLNLKESNMPSLTLNISLVDDSYYEFQRQGAQSHEEAILLINNFHPNMKSRPALLLPSVQDAINLLPITFQLIFFLI